MAVSKSSSDRNGVMLSSPSAVRIARPKPLLELELPLPAWRMSLLGFMMYETSVPFNSNLVRAAQKEALAHNVALDVQAGNSDLSRFETSAWPPDARYYRHRASGDGGGAWHD